MECKVWTKRDFTDVQAGGETRCIFNGKISVIPALDVGIVVRDGFCVEDIQRIYYDLTDDTVEISLKTMDRNREYGECLLYPTKAKP